MALDIIDEQEDPQAEATPTLAEVFRKAMEAKGLDMKVCVPAKVLKYDKNRQSVDVRPFFHKKYREGNTEQAPIIFNVPVAFPRAGNAFIAMPIKTGHSVMVVFADRSMEKWLASGEEGHPEDTRNHHISDAIAYPGLYPFSTPVKINNDDDIIIGNTGKKNRLEIRVKPNGHIQILNAKEELVKVLDDMLKIIREAKVYTSTGKQPLRHSKFQDVHDRLKTFREK